MVPLMRRWEMQAIGRGNLAIRHVERPEVSDGHVLVKVDAVSLNYRDKLIIETGMGLPLSYPLTLGSDLAGSVVDIGPEVTRFSVGDRVVGNFAAEWLDGRVGGTAREPAVYTLGGLLPGVLSEYVAFPEGWFSLAPRSLDAVAASCLPVAGLTAWYSLVELGQLQPQDIVLIHGTGGVALFALQIAKAKGAKVIVTSAHTEKLRRVQALGADVVIDRLKGDWLEGVYHATSDYGADHIVELVGGANLGKSVQAAAVNGKIYQIGVMDGFELAVPAGPLMLKNISVHGISVGHRRAMENLVRAIDAFEIKPVIDAIYGFDDLPAALDHLEKGPFGKLVIDMH